MSLKKELVLFPRLKKDRDRETVPIYSHGCDGFFSIAKELWNSGSVVAEPNSGSKLPLRSVSGSTDKNPCHARVPSGWSRFADNHSCLEAVIIRVNPRNRNFLSWSQSGTGHSNHLLSNKLVLEQKPEATTVSDIIQGAKREQSQKISTFVDRIKRRLTDVSNGQTTGRDHERYRKYHQTARRVPGKQGRGQGTPRGIYSPVREREERQPNLSSRAQWNSRVINSPFAGREGISSWNRKNNRFSENYSKSVDSTEINLDNSVVSTSIHIKEVLV